MKTLLKLEAHGHVIKLRDWEDRGWVPTGGPSGEHRMDLTLDGCYLAVCGGEHEQLLRGIADKLAYALRAPERKKRPRPKPARV